MAKVALLIGVSEYEAGLNSLPGSVKDVEAMQRVLVHPEMGDFAETEVVALKNPKRQEMEEAIERLFCDRKQEDLLLFYFSGHGIKDETGKLYLSTSATRKENGRLRKASAVSASFLHENINECRSQHQVVILDCCYSGAIAKGMRVKDDGELNIQEQLGGKGRAILTASTSTQYALEQEGFELSIYTHYLVEAIRTGAADQDNDGFISIDELHNYVSRKIKDIYPEMTPGFYPVNEGYKILIAKSPKDDPTLKYRKEAEELAEENGGKFSCVARDLLDDERTKHGISAEVAQVIEDEVLQPYRTYDRKLEDYKQLLLNVIEEEGLVNEIRQKELEVYRKRKGLRDEDVAKFHNNAVASKEIKQTQNQEVGSSQPKDSTKQSASSEPTPTTIPTRIEQPQIMWKFWRKWILTTLLSVIIDFILCVGIARVNIPYNGANAFLTLTLLSFIIGLIQWLMIRGEILNSMQWLLAMVIGAFVGVIAIGFISGTAGMFGFVVSLIVFIGVSGSVVVRLLPKE
jgi:uncharacterized caspase-like protein